MSQKSSDDNADARSAARGNLMFSLCAAIACAVCIWLFGVSSLTASLMFAKAIGGVLITSYNHQVERSDQLTEAYFGTGLLIGAIGIIGAHDYDYGVHHGWNVVTVVVVPLFMIVLIVGLLQVRRSNQLTIIKDCIHEMWPERYTKSEH
jgi:hypothetical protein